MSKNVGTTWSPGSLPGKIKSHPRKALRDHLLNTLDLAKSLVQNNEVPVQLEVLKWICFTHDLGKVDPAFQQYIDGKSNGVPHSLPSSWFTYASTKDVLAAEVVRRHHSHMVNVQDMVSHWGGDGLSAEKIRQSMIKLIPDWREMITEDELDDLSMSLLLEKEFSQEDWVRFRVLYSLFITADRMDALNVKAVNCLPFPKMEIPFFEKDSSMNEWREKVRRNCLANAKKGGDPGIYTLSLPTGTGKTLIGLEIAEKWALEKGYKNLIYALPFISIVEQNAKVAKDVFGDGNVQEDHSMAYDLEESEETNPLARMTSLFRYWSLPVTVTTFSKLWESLFNSKANASMNFHRLSRAVVIMDEPQAVRPQLWSGFGKTLQYLSDKFKTVFLFMTATQPQMVPGEELAPFEIVKQRPFETRHIFKFLDGLHDLDELPGLLLENVPVLEGSGLVVLNTKRSALRAFDLLSETVGDNAVFFLSRNMTPRHRRKVLDELREMGENGIQHYLVSTQVVEAGVDLDFAWAFRDLGPLDSIVQVAGRCNRNFKLPCPGKVLVTELRTKENTRSLCRFVYDDVLIGATKEIIKEYPEFDESQIGGVIDRYFRLISDGLRPESVWDRIGEGKWNELPPLIKEKRYDEIPLYVELDNENELESLLRKYREEKWDLENLAAKKALQNLLNENRIDVRKRDIEEWHQLTGGNFLIDGQKPVLQELPEGQGWLLSNEGIGIVYDRIKGFLFPVRDSDDECI